MSMRAQAKTQRTKKKLENEVELRVTEASHKKRQRAKKKG